MSNSFHQTFVGSDIFPGEKGVTSLRVQKRYLLNLKCALRLLIFNPLTPGLQMPLTFQANVRYSTSVFMTYSRHAVINSFISSIQLIIKSTWVSHTQSESPCNNQKLKTCHFHKAYCLQLTRLLHAIRVQ